MTPIRFAFDSLVLAIGSQVCAHAQAPLYSATTIPDHPGASSILASDVNDHSMIVGSMIVSTGKLPFYVPAGGAPTILPLLGGHSTGEAFGISNAGIVVGHSGDPAIDSRAVIWSPTPSGYVVTAIPATTSGLVPILANEINEHGDVVGRLANGNGFAWRSASGTIDLSTFGFMGQANDVNEARQVIGGHDLIDLDDHTVVHFAAPPVVQNWTITAINDSGRIIAQGSANLSPFGWVAYAYRRDPAGNWVLLGTGNFAGALGIDYAANVHFLAAYSSGTNLVHFAEYGDIALTDLIDPPLANPIFSTFPGAAMSANGHIAVSTVTLSPITEHLLLLEPKPFHSVLEGVAGSAGRPILCGYGGASAATPIRITLSNAAPNAPWVTIVGTSPANLPFFGGVLVPAPNAVLGGFTTDPNGRFEFTTSWPLGAPSGATVFLQDWILDPTAPLGVAGSNALSCIVP